MGGNLFEEWAKGREGEEIGVQATLSDKLLKGARESALEAAAGAMMRGIGYGSLVAGLELAPHVETTEERDAALRAVTLGVYMDGEARPRVEGYILALERANERASKLLAAPWWKLAWQRLRGRLPRMVDVWDIPR